MAATRRRPVLGGVSGFLFGLFLGIDLWLFGVVDSDSVVITILPVVFLVVGLALGLTKPIKFGRRRGDQGHPDTEPDQGGGDGASVSDSGGDTGGGDSGDG